MKAKPKLKFVRVDHRTVIEVPAEIPDDEAIRLYNLKIEANNRKYEHYKPGQRWQL